MLFCCLWRNVEASCHKHFVVVSRHQQTPPLTTSDKCHNLPRSVGTVLITSSRPQRRQHAMKPDIGSESRFLPIPPAFDAPVRGGGFRRMIGVETRSSTVAKRPRDASCLSVVSFSSTKRRAESSVVSCIRYRFITACN